MKIQASISDSYPEWMTGEPEVVRTFDITPCVQNLVEMVKLAKHIIDNPYGRTDIELIFAEHVRMIMVATNTRWPGK